MLSTGPLLNSDVYKVGLSTPGMVGLIVIGFLAVILIFIELGVMIVIAQQRYFRKNVLLTNALVTSLRKIPRLLGFGFFQLLILSLFILPFIDFSFFLVLIDVNVPIYVTNWFDQASFYILALYIALFVVAFYLFIRWIFVLHFFLIENKDILEAIKQSWILTKVNQRKIIFHLCFFNIFIFIIWVLLVNVLSYVPKITDMIILSELVKNYLVTFSSYMALVFSLLFMPLNIIVVTRLFYLFKKKQGDKIKDDIKIYGNWTLISIERKIVHFLKRRKCTFIVIILLIFTGMFLINTSLNNQIIYLKWNVQVAAHRGDSGNAPENSLSSIRSAIEKGVDAVEIDVMLTKDRVVILNHDYTFQRVAGVPYKVKDMTYEEVAQVDIGWKFSLDFAGEKVPTLEEVFDELQDYNVTLIIDLKPTDSTGELSREVVKLVEKFEMEDDVYIQAFDYPSLQAVREENSEIKIGQILYLVAGDLTKLDVDFYTIRQTMLSERFIKNARRQNREVWVWTVNKERNIKEVLKYDIDGIITGYPERVQRAIGIGFREEKK
ncbi:MAG: glycerophosphoryl diester phosphodiesterase membrane domain-containing protein [Bacillaceae bacterium]|nr:glycerophosphoryl diester phosphodiesterase membrane domain-containing protein [Bacillaceae bacterium]